MYECRLISELLVTFADGPPASFLLLTWLYPPGEQGQHIAPTMIVRSKSSIGFAIPQKKTTSHERRNHE
jgi:hypothetical protein